LGNSLGNASLILGTVGGGLVNGLASSAKAVHGWSTKVQTSIAGAFSGVAGKVTGFLGNAKSIMGGAGAALGFALGGPLGAAIGQKVGEFVGGIGETIFNAIAAPFDKLKELGGIVKQATTLGVSASDLQGMQQLLSKVGIEADQAGHVFAIMGKNIVNGGGAASSAMASMGVSAQQLAGMSLTEQFKVLADGISRLPPGAQQAAAAMAIFGKTGDQLLPMLQRGGAGIDAFIAQQRGMGAVLSDEQLQAAAAASKAWTESKNQIKAAWDGLVNRATLIAAPIVKVFGGLVSKSFALLTPVFDWVGRAIERVSVILEAAGEVFSQWIDVAITWVKNLIGQVGAFGAGWPTVETIVTAVLRTVAVALSYVWDTLRAGIGAMAFVASFVVEGFGKIVEAFKDTIKDLLGLAGQLPDALGGDTFRDMIPRVDQWGTRIQQAGRDMRQFGRNAVTSWGDSARATNAWFDQLDFRRRQVTAAAAAAAATVNQAIDFKPTAAILKGSKEAYSIESKFAFDSQYNPRPPAETPEVREQRRTNLLLEMINRGIGESIRLSAG
jgi:hypothetical protein